MGAIAIVIVSFVLMEPLTALTHRYVMHGVGRALHRSHHRRVRPGESPVRWEANDAYPVMFATVVMAGFATGFNVAGFGVLVPVGIGITAYGAAYALVHDVYIHGRLPLFRTRRVATFDRLADAHLVHHRYDGAPYGMLVPVMSKTVRRSQVSASGSRPPHVPLDA